MTLAKHIARRFKAEKKPTFAEARQKVFGFLKSHGWDVKDSLSVPHATSPDRKVRLWFKSQAVYAVHQKRVEEGSNPLEFKDSHSMESDLRAVADEAKFGRLLEHWTGHKL